MRILLINPPLSVNEFPHLALPLLKGYLKKQGIRCDIKDYNVELMDEIIKEGLEKVERYFYEHGMKIPLKEVKRRFTDARNTFLLKERQGKYERAQKLINTYLRIAGSNIYDTCFRPDSLQSIKDGYNFCNLKDSPNRILKYIRENVLTYIKNNPYKTIGISVPFASQIFYSLIIGREIKKILPDCKVILGGPQISLFWKVLIQYEPFRASYDGMMYGLGEVSLEKYIRATYKSDDFSTVPSLIYWDKNNDLQVNKKEEIQEMSEIPTPDFFDLPLDKYIFAKLPYQMSRGCYWGRCTFCSYRETKGYIKRNIEQVVNHISELEKRYERHIFHFIDDAIHPDLLTNFANKLVKSNMNIRYDAYLRLDKRFTPDVCQLLARSGLKSVLFGLESANQRILNLMNKGTTPENMLRVLKSMKTAGIQNVVSCLIGFPTETKEEARESIQFLKENRNWYYHAYIVHFGMISDMYNNAEKYSVYDLDFNNLVCYDDSGFSALGYPYKTNIGMTLSDAFEVIKEGRNELNIKTFDDNFFS